MLIKIAEACQLLEQGDVVALPTETVYGLAARIDRPNAVKHIFELKNRPLNNPLIIHVNGYEQIKHFTSEIPPNFSELAEAFWPGPLTIILPVHEDSIFPEIRAGLATAGFRVPGHPLTLEVIHRSGPIVMPSANLSGRPSATQPAHVEEDFGMQFPVLDGGICHRGLESSIIAFYQGKWTLLRLGAISSEEFIPVLGYEPEFGKATSKSKPLCPGQLYRHYAPQAYLILCDRESDFDQDQVIIGFKERSYPQASKIYYLGSEKDPKRVAEQLYILLRQLDKDQIKEAFVDMRFPGEGLWKTIRERLLKASNKI